MPTDRLAIATRNEGPLHAGLKRWYARRGDRTEARVGGHQVDIVRDGLLIEIQTANLGALRRKLEHLLDDHRVHVVHPVARERWIVRVDGDGVIGRRRSPKRGRVEDAFRELVSLPRLLVHPNLSCEIVLTHEEEVRRHEPGRAWRRRGWVVVERRLLDVVDSRTFHGLADLRGVLPSGLPRTFTTADIAGGLDVSRDLAQKIAYCLRESGAITAKGKRGNALTYRVTS